MPDYCCWKGGRERAGATPFPVAKYTLQLTGLIQSAASFAGLSVDIKLPRRCEVVPPTFYFCGCLCWVNEKKKMEVLTANLTPLHNQNQKNPWRTTYKKQTVLVNTKFNICLGWHSQIRRKWGFLIVRGRISGEPLSCSFELKEPPAGRRRNKPGGPDGSHFGTSHLTSP